MKKGEVVMLFAVVYAAGIAATITAGLLMKRGRSQSTLLAQASDGFDT